MADKQLAIIHGVRCGVGDRGRAWLSFDVKLSESSGALLILEWDDAKDFIEAYEVRDVAQLDGKPVWVKNEAGRVSIVGPAKL